MDWFESGSHNFSLDASNLVKLLDHVTLLAHEWGHELWRGFFNHVSTVGNNAVPASGTRQYAYRLMSLNDRGGAETISTHERLLLGWLTPAQIGSSGSGQSFTVGDLYTTADAVTLVVPTGTVYLSNRQRIAWFDELRRQPEEPHPYDDIFKGLKDTGVLAQFTTDGEDLLDVLPADNTLEVGDYEGDLYGPDSGRQLTPWTMPNVNGCNGYTTATDPLCDDLDPQTDAMWQAVDDIRYTGAADSTMAFTYYHDFRTAPEVVVRSDSWMGQETATSSGGTSYTFTKPVRVTEGAVLRVWENSTIVFAGGLTVEDGAEFICKTGSTCVVPDDVLITGAESCVLAEAGATVRFEGSGAVTATAGGFLMGKGGTFEFADGRDFTATGTADTTGAEAGTVFRLSSGSSLYLGSPVRLIGTSADPVRVERLASGSQWGDIELRADGSYLKYVTLDGGTRNVYVRSRNNQLWNVTSRDGWQNLQVYSQHDGGGRGQVSVYNSTFEGASTHGVMAYSGDFSMSSVTVRDNAQSGLWVKYGDVSLGYTDVLNNGITQNRDGVALFNGADLVAWDYSMSRFEGNGRHELYTSGSAWLDLSYGYNNVCDAGDPGVTGKLVYEGGSNYVYAVQNWWGTPSPTASMFYGDVTYYAPAPYPYVGGGSCASSAAGSGSSFASGPTVASGADGGAGVATSGVAAASARADGPAERPVERGDLDPAALRRAVQEARAALTAGAATAEGPALAVALYGAQRRLDRVAPDEGAAERAPTMALFDGLRQAAGPTQERAALVALDDALRSGDTRRARALLDAHGARVSTPLGRAELAQAWIEVLRQEGRYAEALAALGESAEVLGGVYVSAVEAVLLAEAGEAEAVVAEAQVAETLAASLAAEPLLETGLQVPYPNPTTGAVTVPVTLGEAGVVRVAVYDALGREVAVLASGPLGEGRHPLAFDGRALPVGVYVVRATVEVEDGSTESFVRRLTVVR